MKLLIDHTYYITQIKICAEYQDMLPRPRLVCQEPGLRLIGRSPGVLDKSSQRQGSMTQYSAQILIFYSMHFPIFNSFVGLVGNLAEMPPCTQSLLPLAIAIKMRLLIRQSNLPACLAEVQQHENILWQLCHRTGEIGRWSGWNIYQWEVFNTGANWMESFIAYL